MEDKLRAWSHGMYGLLQSLWLAKQNQLGDTKLIQSNIESLCIDVPSSLGFDSSVPLRNMKPNSIRIIEEDEENIIDIATRALINNLLVTLVVIFDEVCSSLIPANLASATRMPGQKALWLKQNVCNDKFLWAGQGVIELIAIRNALVHENGFWGEKQLNLLSQSGIADSDLPGIGTAVSPGVEDLFRYRRAVRTSLNELGKHFD
jgi:hypothetical protein